jgi:hypothetical protein
VLFRSVDGWDGDDAGALARLAGERVWAGEFIAECTKVRRAVDVASVRDSYFGVTTAEGHRMEDLYPLTVDFAALEVAHGA